MYTETTTATYCNEITPTSNTEESLALLKIQNKKISDLYQLIDDKDNEIKQLKDIISSLESKQKQTHILLQSKDTELKETQNQVHQQNTTQQTLFEDFATLQSICKDNAGKLAKYEDDITNLSSELKDIYERNRLLKDKNYFLLKEKNALIERTDTLTESEQLLKNKVTNLISALTAKDNEINQLKVINATISNEKNIIESNFNSLMQKQKHLNAKLMESETEKEGLLRELKVVNIKYNENVNKTNILNEEKYKMQLQQENLEKLNHETNLQVHEMHNKNTQLNQVIDQTNKNNISLYAQLNKLIDIISSDISSIINIIEHSLRTNTQIDKAKLPNIFNIKEQCHSFINTIPSVSSILTAFDKLNSFALNISEHNISYYQSIKSYESKLALYEQMTVDSNNKILNLQEETSKQNATQQFQLQQHSDEQLRLNQLISSLRNEINTINNVILHSFNEIQRKYNEISTATLRNSITLSDINNTLFVNGINNTSDIKDFVFHIESINKNLLNYIFMLSEENKKVVGVNEEKNELKQKIMLLQNEMYSLNLLIDKNKAEFKQTKEIIVNDYQQQMSDDIRKTKDIAMIEIQNLNKCIIQKDEEIKRLTHNYGLLYSQYRLLQQGVKN
jgi:chromosome segregation ATPase